jgi:hypothetical protein
MDEAPFFAGLPQLREKRRKAKTALFAFRR